jgi:hypothetical protein
MIVKNIPSLPNFHNGKLYKRWVSVFNVFGNDGLLASKTNKDGTITQLLITDGGRTRKLFNNEDEIIDEIDINGLKRTFVYVTQPDGKTKGTMRISNDTPEDKRPFVVFAKWISVNLRPISAELTLNPKHSGSLFSIKEKVPENKVIKEYKERIVHAKLEKFEDSPIQVPLPAKVTLTAESGAQKVVDGTIEDSKPYVQQLELLSGKPNIMDDMRI